MACQLLLHAWRREDESGKVAAVDTFSPELCGAWLNKPELPERSRPELAASPDGLSPAQQVALEELVERVSAARSVV